MTPPEYDAWVLDLDGTLVDVEPAHVRWVFDEVGQRLGRAFTDHEASILWHGLTGERNRVLEAKGIEKDRFWSVFHEVEDPRKRAEATYLYDDARAVADLDAPTAIVTHCQEYLTGPVLDHQDIRDWFDVVICCTDDLGWKPDPAPVERALSDLGVRGEGVLVGDSPHDVGAAWNAGLDAVHVERHDPADRGQCVLADYRVERLDEFGPLHGVAADGGRVDDEASDD